MTNAAEHQLTGGGRSADRSKLLVVDDLTVAFERRSGLISAVDGVSFDLDAGEALGIVGESGSGKSLTARAVMGLLRHARQSGRIVLNGVDTSTLDPAAIRALRSSTVSMIFQDPLSHLNPVLRVDRQVGEMLHARSGLSWREARRVSIALMERVGIPDAARRARDYPHQFSGGMRQRLMIAMALANQPKLLIADEPTTALDVTVQAQVLALLRDLRNEGMAIIMISHDLAVIAQIAQRVAVMYAGRIVEHGIAADLLTGPTHPYTRALLDARPRAVEEGATHAPGVSERRRLVTGSPPQLTRMPSGCRLHPRCALAREHCSLEYPELRPTRRGLNAACHFWEDLVEWRSDDDD